MTKHEFIKNLNSIITHHIRAALTNNENHRKANQKAANEMYEKLMETLDKLYIEQGNIK